MKVYSKTFDRADLTAETGVFNIQELAKVAAAIANKEAPFEAKDFRYTFNGAELRVVLYSSIRPARTS